MKGAFTRAGNTAIISASSPSSIVVTLPLSLSHDSCLRDLVMPLGHLFCLDRSSGRARNWGYTQSVQVAAKEGLPTNFWYPTERRLLHANLDHFGTSPARATPKAYGELGWDPVRGDANRPTGFPSWRGNFGWEKLNVGHGDQILAALHGGRESMRVEGGESTVPP